MLAHTCLIRLKLVHWFLSFIIIFSVVTQTFDIKVEVLAAARGCTAVLKCVLPSFVKDYVRITSWIQEPSFFIYPSLQGGKLEKYF